MRRTPLGAWVWTALWATWILAVQGAWAAGSTRAAWTPNLAAILLVAVGPHVGRSTLRGLVVVLCCAHAALSLDPPVAVVAGYFGAASLYRGVAATFQLEGLTGRAVAAGGVAFLLSWWLFVVQTARAGTAADALVFEGWKSGAATLVAAAVLAPLFARLPGVRRLGGRRP